MKKLTSASVLRIIALLAALSTPAISLASAEPAATDQRPNRKGGPPAWQRTEPKWVLDRIEAPHLNYATFESAAAGEKVSYLIYLPPGYEASADERFPVAYWLHGIGGSQQGLPGFCERLTGAIESGKCPPMIVVFVNGMVSSFYCDAVNAKIPVETVIVKELIPHIDATYRTIASREGRMIEGFSMGGFGATRLGFKHPDLFGSISSIDGALIDLNQLKQRHGVIFDRVFGSDERFAAESPFTLSEKNADAVRGRTAIRLAVGPLRQPNANYHELLKRLDIAHDYEEFEGAPHSHQVIYDQLGERNWDFYRKAFAAALPTAATK